MKWSYTTDSEARIVQMKHDNGTEFSVAFADLHDLREALNQARWQFWRETRPARVVAIAKAVGVRL
jgi:hypothetical protein